MKNLNLLFLLPVLVVALSACSKKNDGANNSNNNDQYAALNLPQECSGPYDYRSSSSWSTYRSAGCSPYEWGSGGAFNQQGCQDGLIPSCGSGVGMICVPNRGIRNSQVAWYDYQRPHGGQFGHFRGFKAGIRRNGRNNARAFYAAPAPTSFGRSCLVGPMNSCGYGSCQPINNTGIGICVQ